MVGITDVCRQRPQACHCQVRATDRRPLALGKGLIGKTVKHATFGDVVLINCKMRPYRAAVGHRQMVTLHEIFCEAFPVCVPDMLF